MLERFNVVKKGYDPDEVETYIETLESVIKSYKEKDSAIKNAIINAQIAADNIVRDAEIQTKKIYQETVDKLNKISASVNDQKRIIHEFQDDYNTLVSKYVHNFNNQEVLKLYTKVNELEEYLAKLQSPMEDE